MKFQLSPVIWCNCIRTHWEMWPMGQRAVSAEAINLNACNVVRFYLIIYFSHCRFLTALPFIAIVKRLIYYIFMCISDSHLHFTSCKTLRNNFHEFRLHVYIFMSLIWFGIRRRTMWMKTTPWCDKSTNCSTMAFLFTV